MAIAYLQHGFISRQKQAEPYTAVAHAKYILRKSACQKVMYQHVPKAYRQLLGWIKGFEDGLRKNARVVDKLVLAVHKELTLEQAETLVTRFKWAVTQGRTPFLVALQDFGSDNPHAHVMLFDRDVETGKRVFQTTEQGSTERLKAIWQDESNAYLAELGIDARIQFGPKQEQSETLDALPEPQSEGGDNLSPPPDQFMPSHEMVSDRLPDQFEQHLEMVSDHLPGDTAPPEPVTSSHDLPEPEPDAYVEPEPSEPAVIVREGAQLLKGTLADLLDAARERTMVLTAVERRNAAWEAYRDAEQRHTEAAKVLARSLAQREGAANDVQAAQWRLDAVAPGGKKKGFRVSLFGFEWQSPKYKQAVAAEQEHAARYATYERAAALAEQADQLVKDTSAEAFRLKETALQLTDHVKVYGNDDEVLEALQTMQQTIRSVAGQIDFEELRNAFDSGEITREEYLEAVELMGEAQEVEQGEGQGQSY